MTTTTRRARKARKALKALTTAVLAVILLSPDLEAQAMPQTKKEQIRGAAKVIVEQLKGTVVHVEGNTLVVRMDKGDLRHFVVPDSRRFLIDGRELRVEELKPGTSLQATVTTTTTPITQRTTTIGTGTVFYVSGKNVIVTLPDGENKMYKVEDSYRFIIGGGKATVAELKKGMTISAEKIVEEPATELETTTVVTGHAPRQKK
jgi:hypothetical protein